MAVDWSKIRAQAGDWVCPDHGIVTPWQQIVPACRDCLRAVHRMVFREGKLMSEEPRPKTCGGPDRHPLVAGQVQLGTVACSCSASGIHRTWTCQQCGDVQQWPPHSDVDAAPYFGPGSR